MTDERNARMNLVLGSDLKLKVKEQAKKQGLTASGYVRNLLIKATKLN